MTQYQIYITQKRTIFGWTKYEWSIDRISSGYMNRPNNWSGVARSEEKARMRAERRIAKIRRKASREVARYKV